MRESFWTVPRRAAQGTLRVSATPRSMLRRTIAGWLMVREMLTLVQGDAIVELVDVLYGVDGDAEAADLALGELEVGVVPGERGVVEVGAEAGLAVRKEEAVPLVGGAGGAEAGDLPTGPGPPAVHGGVGAAG